MSTLEAGGALLEQRFLIDHTPKYQEALKTTLMPFPHTEMLILVPGPLLWRY